MENKNITDQKFMAILRGGEYFKMLIDPHRLTSEGCIDNITLDAKGRRWRCRVVFPVGATLHIEGTLADWRPSITKVMMPTPAGEKEEIRCRTANTLLESIAPLSGIPERLKRVLSRDAKKTGVTPVSELLPYVRIIDSAVIWGVETHKKINPLEGFTVYRLKFDLNPAGEAYGVDVSVINDRKEGRIILSMRVDVYGLNNKKVTMEKNLGLGRTVSVDCKAKKEKKLIPSLLVAEDLYDALPAMYGNQRSEQKVIEGPRSAKKR